MAGSASGIRDVGPGAAQAVDRPGSADRRSSATEPKGAAWRRPRSSSSALRALRRAGVPPRSRTQVPEPVRAAPSGTRHATRGRHCRRFISECLSNTVECALSATGSCRGNSPQRCESSWPLARASMCPGSGNQDNAAGPPRLGTTSEQEWSPRSTRSGLFTAVGTGCASGSSLPSQVQTALRGPPSRHPAMARLAADDPRQRRSLVHGSPAAHVAGRQQRGRVTRRHDQRRTRQLPAMSAPLTPRRRRGRRRVTLPSDRLTIRLAQPSVARWRPRTTPDRRTPHLTAQHQPSRPAGRDDTDQPVAPPRPADFCAGNPLHRVQAVPPRAAPTGPMLPRTTLVGFRCATSVRPMCDQRPSGGLHGGGRRRKTRGHSRGAPGARTLNLRIKSARHAVSPGRETSQQVLPRLKKSAISSAHVRRGPRRAGQCVRPNVRPTSRVTLCPGTWVTLREPELNNLRA
jgi:hypothetical protein